MRTMRKKRNRKRRRRKKKRKRKRKKKRSFTEVDCIIQAVFIRSFYGELFWKQFIQRRIHRGDLLSGELFGGDSR